MTKYATCSSPLAATKPHSTAPHCGTASRPRYQPSGAQTTIMITEVKNANRESTPAFLATMFQHAWIRPARMMRAKAVKVTVQKERGLLNAKSRSAVAAAAWRARKGRSIEGLNIAQGICNWRDPSREPPCKGRPAALVASPCPHRPAVRERGEGAQRLRGVISKLFR